MASRPERDARALLGALWTAYQQDEGGVERHRRRDLAREEALPELREIVLDLAEERSSLADFLGRMQQFSLNHQSLWGFNAYGQMAVNMLATSADERDVPAIREAVAPPRDLEEGVARIASLVAVCQELRERARDAGTPRSAPAPGSMPYVQSFLWEAFDREAFPVYWPRSRESLRVLGLFEETRDFARDYRHYVEVHAEIRQRLGLDTWSLEHALAWFRDHPFIGFVSGDFEAARENRLLNSEQWNTRSGYASPEVEDAAKRNVRQLMGRLGGLAERLKGPLQQLLPDHPIKACSERSSWSETGRYRPEAWIYLARDEASWGDAPMLRVWIDSSGVYAGLYPRRQRYDFHAEVLEATKAEVDELVERHGFGLFKAGTEMPLEQPWEDDPRGEVLVARRWTPQEAVEAGPGLADELLGALKVAAPVLRRWEEIAKPPTPQQDRAWLVRATVEGVDRSSAWLSEGYAAIGWVAPGDIDPGIDREELREALALGYPERSPAQIASDAGNLVRFLQEMSVGDLVATPAGNDLHVGTVTSEPYWIDGVPDGRRRSVEWKQHHLAWRQNLSSEVRQALGNRQAVSEVSAFARELTAPPGPTSGFPAPSITFDEDRADLYVKLADLETLSPEETVTVHRAHAAEHGQVWFMGNMTLAGGRAGQFNAGVAEGRNPVLILGRRGIGIAALAVILEVVHSPEPQACPDLAYLPDYYPREVKYKTWMRVGPLLFPNELQHEVAAEDFELLNNPGTRLTSILDKRPSMAYLRYAPAAVALQDVALALPTPEAFAEGYARIREELAVDRAVVERIVAHLVAGKSVILTGPTGSGKTALAKLIPRVLFNIEPFIVTATADWTSYEVIGGLFPEVHSGADDKQELGYGIRRGHVYEAVLRNWQTDGQGTLLRLNGQPARQLDQVDGTTTVGTWLVIDEFNRADIDKAFGDLFTAIEYRSLRVPAIDPEQPGAATREIPIPRHFRIIATMNSFDRNYLYAISDALKRRFAFVDVGLPSDVDEERGKVRQRVLASLKDAGITVEEELLEGAEEQLYGFLGFVRLFRPIGVAQAIACLEYAGVRAGLGELAAEAHLQEALLADVVPQLENLPTAQLACIRHWAAGNESGLAGELLAMAAAEPLTPARLRDLAEVTRHLAACTTGRARERCAALSAMASGPTDEDLGARLVDSLRGGPEPALAALLQEELRLDRMPEVAARLAEYESERGY